MVIERIIKQKDGSEIRIRAESSWNIGWSKCNAFVDVFKRESENGEWRLLNDRPHPDWKTMPLDDYLSYGRSEVFRTVSPGTILDAIHHVCKLDTIFIETKLKERLK